MIALTANPAFESLSHEAQIRAAVLKCFCDSSLEPWSRFDRLSSNDWQRLLHWLDVSGLALSFLDRILELQLRHRLPPAIVARLEQNLRDNTERTLDMIAESTAIQIEFQRASFSYAVLKGFSFCPIAVPRPELRSQLDLDFLIAEKDAPEARRILESRGYQLHAVSGRSWEFKTPYTHKGTLADLYKALPFHCVELHLETGSESRNSLLERVERRDFNGITTPVLPAADLFFGQGMHLFKHVCSEFSRTAHLLEFWRHVVARRDDPAFWQKVKTIAEASPRAALGLGVVTLLTTRTMSDFAPDAFTCWTVDRMPAAVRLWVELYGYRSVLGDFPGSKIYLLLQRELEIAGIGPKRSAREVLLPLKLPPPIAIAPEDESLLERFRRYRGQFKFVFFRLSFHSVEGLRYLRERMRWRRKLSELQRQSAHPHRGASSLPLELAGTARCETKE
jgi:hypothetical protein